MIRIGIVGCGRILAAHLRGYRLLREAGVDDFRIAALCARKEDDARMYIQRGQGPPQRPAVSDIPGDPLAIDDEYLSDFQDAGDVRVYTDYREMIAEGPIDAVNDYTTHELHHQVAAAAMEHGRDLLSQKPLAVTVRAARQMCEEAERAGRVLGVFENVRFEPAARHLRWLFDSGRGGRLRMALIGFIGAWWAPDRIVARTPWRHRLLEAGGISLDMGVHLFDMVRHLGGEVRDVSARTAVLEPVRYTRDAKGDVVDRVECDADDTFFASFETEAGATGTLMSSWSGAAEPTTIGPGMVFYGERCRATDGRVAFQDGSAADLGELYETECDAARRERDMPLGLSDSFALAQYDWLRAVRDRTEPETSGREGLRDLGCAYAIVEAAKAGRRVTVEEVLEGELREYQRPIDQRYGLDT